MSEQQTNKTTGGVWVACSERLPSINSGLGHLRKVLVRESNGKKYWLEYYYDVGDSDSHTHWLDTTVEIVTKEEHESEVAELRKENEELRASNEELRKRYDEARLLIKRCTDAFYRDGNEDSETIDDAMSAALDWISQEELEEEIFGDKCDDHEYLD